MSGSEQTLSHEAAITAYFDQVQQCEEGGLIWANTLFDPMLFPGVAEDGTPTMFLLQQLAASKNIYGDRAFEDVTLRKAQTSIVTRVLATVATREHVHFENIATLTVAATDTITAIEHAPKLPGTHRRNLLRTFSGIAASRTNSQDPRQARAIEVIRHIPLSRPRRVAQDVARLATPEAFSRMRWL